MIDRPVFEWLSGHHVGWLDRWMPAIARVTGASAWLIVAAFVATVLFLEKRRHQAGWLLIGASIGSSLAALFKPWIHRARPPVALVHHHGWSFPSGHATSSLAVLSLLAYYLGERKPRTAKYLWPAVAALALLIGFNRVYLGAHWATDVLGGWLLGGTFAYLWCRRFPRPQRPRES